MRYVWCTVKIPFCMSLKDNRPVQRSVRPPAGQSVSWKIVRSVTAHLSPTCHGMHSSVWAVFNWNWNCAEWQCFTEGEQIARGLTHLYILFLSSLQLKFFLPSSLSTPNDLAVIDCRTLWLGPEKHRLWGVCVCVCVLERGEEMDLLTCDFDSGQCISTCIIGNDETRGCQGQLNIDQTHTHTYTHTHSFKSKCVGVWEQTDSKK